MPLLPYQKEGLAWMINQEDGPVRGGILADEMGMGKTIQTVSLLLARESPLRVLRKADDNQVIVEEKTADNPTEDASSSPQVRSENEHEMAMDAVEDVQPGVEGKKAKAKKARKPPPDTPTYSRGGTLIVLPTVAIRQWQSEISRFTAEGAMSVQVYHGSDRSSTISSLTATDVVITSYKIVESEYRKATAGAKVTCRVCKRKFYPDKLRTHRRYFCGSGAMRTSAQAKTLKKSTRGPTKVAAGDGDDEDNGSRVEEGTTPSIYEDDEITTADSVAQANSSGMPTLEEILRRQQEQTSKLKNSIDSSATIKTKKKMRISKASTAAKKATRGKTSKARKRSSASDSDFEDSLQDTDSEDEAQNSIDSSATIKTKKKMRISKASTAAKKATRGKTSKARKRSSASDSDFEDSLQDTDSEDEAQNSIDSSATIKTKKKMRISKASTAAKKATRGKTSKARKRSSASDSDFEDSLQDTDSEEEAQSGAGEWYNEEQARKRGISVSRLHQISWFRIVLDEAHAIKDRSTSTAKAIFQLVSLYKWCLSGTPLQNRVSELFAQSKGCHCKSLHWQFTGNKSCKSCGHGPMQHYSMLKLKSEVLDEILMRRTKETRASDIQLPPRIVKVRRERLDENEEDFYTAIYSQSKAQFSTYVQAGTVLNNYANIFEVLMRLRQAIDHPYLVIHSNTQHDAGLQEKQLLDEIQDTLCGLCKDPVEDARRADCGHIFCCACIQDYMDTVKTKKIKKAIIKCPCCENENALSIDISATIDLNNTEPDESAMDVSNEGSILDKIDLNNFVSSTKIEALMQDLHRMQKTDFGAKAIVFSQFTSMLDIIEHRISTDRFTPPLKCALLMGNMSLDQRDRIIRQFNSDPHLKVLLISLKAGGVALNLTVASHIFIMDPWWSPAAEMQAIDRTHRFGQHKPIHATRFITEGTIEERILRLQEKKRLVFDATIGGDAGSVNKLTTADMAFLFA
eukprot:GSChrysophyteH1.ASY1.ANO1.1804.1 assembled CDS